MASSLASGKTGQEERGNIMTQKTLAKNLDEYTELTRQITALEAKKQAVADRIKDAMGEAEEVQCGDYTARYKNVTTSRFDTKAFQQNHKRLYAAFCRPQTVRRFTVTA